MQSAQLAVFKNEDFSQALCAGSYLSLIFSVITLIEELSINTKWEDRKWCAYLDNF